MFFTKARLSIAASLLLLTVLCTGCLKDDCRNQYTIYRPLYKSLRTVRSQMKFEPAQRIEKLGKIYQYGNYLLLNDIGKGIHVFDNSNPAAPKKIGFLNIAGNVDMAIRNNVLYADSYGDLAVIPIQNWNNAKPVAFKNRVFADRGFYWNNTSDPDSAQVIVGYEQKDTTVDCETATTWNNCPNCAMQDLSGRTFFASASAAAAPVVGTGGSMARFTLVQNHLYTVTNSDLGTFDVSDALNPVQTGSHNLGWGIETIYPFQNKLFIGSTTGMFIFDLANPAMPVEKGRFSHARSCDPVIADGNTAYVTLRSDGNRCGGNQNQMDILNISNLQAPQLEKTVQFTNPHGLSKDGNLLFVCDGDAGLKIFDAQDPRNPQPIRTIDDIGSTYDVIAQGGVALVVSSTGMYQYSYSNSGIIRLLSKTSLN